MKIRIHKLRMKTLLGIYPAEKKTPRDIVINLILELKSGIDFSHGDIATTADYYTISRRITDFVESGSFDLIEELVEKLLTLIGEFSTISKATVEIFKPGCIPNADAASAEGERRYD